MISGGKGGIGNISLSPAQAELASLARRAGIKASTISGRSSGMQRSHSAGNSERLQSWYEVLDDQGK